MWGIVQENLKYRLSASWPGPWLPEVAGYFICFEGFGSPWMFFPFLWTSGFTEGLYFIFPVATCPLWTKERFACVHWYLKVVSPVVFWPFVPKLLYFLEPGPGLSWCWSCCIPACYLWMTFMDKHKIIFIPSLLLLYCWNNLVCLRLDSTVFVKNLCNRNGGPLPAVLPGYLYPK